MAFGDRPLKGGGLVGGDRDCGGSSDVNGDQRYVAGVNLAVHLVLVRNK